MALYLKILLRDSSLNVEISMLVSLSEQYFHQAARLTQHTLDTLPPKQF